MDTIARLQRLRLCWIFRHTCESKSAKKSDWQTKKKKKKETRQSIHLQYPGFEEIFFFLRKIKENPCRLGKFSDNDVSVDKRVSMPIDVVK